MDTPPGETRTKPVRITVDLTPADYQALNRWVAEAAIELNRHMSRLSQAQIIRAMIRAADGVVSGVVLDAARLGQRRPEPGSDQAAAIIDAWRLVRA